MKTVYMIAIATLVILGGLAAAQEVIPTPDPIGPAQAEAGSKGTGSESWRYRWVGGHWWYWTVQNHWMVYSDEGHWLEYHPEVAAGVQPSGSANVAVGRRIGVDVWGPHGDVRVGRIYVDW